MLAHCYLRNDVVYVPTVVQLKTGAYMNVDPVAVVPSANAGELRRAFAAAFARGNAVVPLPPKDKWPPPVLPKYAGVKTWSAFMRDAAEWDISEKAGIYKITPWKKDPEGGPSWVPDLEHRIAFPPNTARDEVIERLIAIVQDVAHTQ